MDATNQILAKRRPSLLAISREALASILAALMITILGAAVRLYFVLYADFPINDGGLFFQMTNELIQNRFHLPVYTSYNFMQIPYAYPPLGFYLVGMLHKLSGLDVIKVCQYLPAILNILTVPAFFLLAREITQRDQITLFATIVFALLPPGYEWLVMGGGVTRSPGFLFSIVTVWLFLKLIREKKTIFAVYAGIFAGLTSLSHLQIYFITVIWLTLAAGLTKNRRWAITRLIAIGFISIILSSPWWLTIIRNHGLAPFLNAFQTGGFDLGAGLIVFLLSNITGELTFTPILVFGLFGLILQIQKKDWLLPLFVAAVVLFDTRSLPRSMLIPLSVLAGIAIYEIGIKSVTKFASSGRKDRKIAMNAAGLIFIFYLLLRAGITTQLLVTTNSQEMKVLALADREAAQWINWNIPDTSQFFVITPPKNWCVDRVSEWFPAIAERRSLNTVQGTEWLANQQFKKQQDLYKKIQACSLKGLECIEAKATESNLQFTHVYISGKLYDPTATYSFPMPLETELRASPVYRLIYENGDVLIFEKDFDGASINSFVE